MPPLQENDCVVELLVGITKGKDREGIFWRARILQMNEAASFFLARNFLKRWIDKEIQKISKRNGQETVHRRG